MIHILDSATIDRIAAGEVIDRPKSVVKELCENAVDAGASAVSVEIAGGGIDLIRVTDNGSGMTEEDLPRAFLRHATSKIRDAADLLTVRSLGFRGEALSSIAAVAKVQVTTKTQDAVLGSLYRIEGGKELGLESVGAPDGTTFVVRDLFYNTPVRRKFLRTPQTEANYVSDLMEQLAMSRPDVSFRYKVNGREKLFTTGNGNISELIYRVFGREIEAGTVPVEAEREWVRLNGFIGKPFVSRGSRAFENYYINGRYIRSADIGAAIEEAYAPYLMQHRFPFTALYFTIAPELLDVNVHPSKMELRLRDREEIASWVSGVISDALKNANKIPNLVLPAPHRAAEGSGGSVGSEGSREDPVRREASEVPEEPKRSPGKTEVPPEPFETRFSERFRKEAPAEAVPQREVPSDGAGRIAEPAVFDTEQLPIVSLADALPEGETEELYGKFRLIGQLFNTYWLCQYRDRFLMVDQHAAHEKVYYERIMRGFDDQEHAETQRIDPPMILTLTALERENLSLQSAVFARLGFVIEEFGGNEICVRGVPANLFSVPAAEQLKELLDEPPGPKGAELAVIRDRVATMSCKAAVKGRDRLSFAEAESLIREMLKLEDPYHCPHGRPTTVEMTRTEIEKAFKRIV
ncbi:MAG: DNA mismatch repair endonuclease MutL [Lachnospiraceae bacterium]|nr:DNA mismatch repair endonuclease MutL [Lachnospiraceae bacterium]